MTKCPSSPVKHRVALGKGRPSNYKRGIRGHAWRGYGSERRCERCNRIPKNLMKSVGQYLGYEGKQDLRKNKERGARSPSTSG